MTPQRLEQIRALLARTPYENAELHPLAGDASFRRYVRVHKDGRTAMLMDAPPGKEDVLPFVAIAEHLYGKGYSTPAILARDVEAGLLLLEDLGDDSFTRVLKNASGSPEELYAVAVDVLAQWYDTNHRVADPASLLLPMYDEALLMREVMLFADWFMPQVLGREAAQDLRGDYESLWRKILAQSPLAVDAWVHRDYHADNLMWLPQRSSVQRVGLLDFQDGVYGDAAYDMVSLLEDARRDVPPALADMMCARYLATTGADRGRFMTAYALLGAQRNIKIIGIFSRLAARDGKSHYLNFLPRVWAHLERDVVHPVLEPLKIWLDTYVPREYRGAIALRHTAQDLALTA